MSVRAQFAEETAADGSFVRQDDVFRDWVRADGSTAYPVERNRYHLYVSLACPWASRTVVVRRLKGLEEAIGMTVVDPIRDERGWRFGDGASPRDGEPDPLYGWQLLAQAYAATDPQYRARVTVPILWDRRTERIVSNSDDDIMRMFETEFDAVAGVPDLDLYPRALRPDIDALNERIYHDVNDGVYRAGFATSQAAYERAAYRVFERLDELDTRLASRRYLFGATPVESDWRLFVTLIRFDAVYVGHFKCNLRRIADYANLAGYLRDLYQIDGIAATVDFDHIKRHYYGTHAEINPTGIVPIGPQQDLWLAHGRETLS